MFYHFKIHKQMTRLTYIRTDLISNKTFVYTKDIQIFEYFKKKLSIRIMKLNSVSFFLKLNISVFKIMMYIINHLSVNLIFYNSMFTLKNFCGQKINTKHFLLMKILTCLRRISITRCNIIKGGK